MISENLLQMVRNKPRFNIVALILPLIKSSGAYFMLQKSSTFNGLFFSLLTIVLVSILGIALSITALYRKEQPVKISYIALFLNVVAALVGIAYVFAVIVFALIY